MEQPRTISELRWENTNPKRFVFRTTIFAKFNDNPQEELLLSYFPDEIELTKSELMGKTREQAMNLFKQKNLNYLKS